MNKKGFTMIEILVVMMIIGILIIGVTASARIVQRSGRNTQRKKAAEAITLAVAEYKGNYNSEPAAFSLSGTSCIVGTATKGVTVALADYGFSTITCTYDFPANNPCTNQATANADTLNLCISMGTVDEVRTGLEGSSTPFTIKTQ